MQKRKKKKFEKTHQNLYNVAKCLTDHILRNNNC